MTCVCVTLGPAASEGPAARTEQTSSVCVSSTVIRSTSQCVALTETRTRTSVSSGEPPAGSREPSPSWQKGPVILMVDQGLEMETTKAQAEGKRCPSVGTASLEQSATRTLKTCCACATSCAMATTRTLCAVRTASPTTRPATSKRRPA